MAECFVIQPFDGGKFDRRYDEVIVPAVRAAGLEPHRVDRDPSVSVPIDTIERWISQADCCLADISDDSPNVWYEIGFAQAAGAPLVPMCGPARRAFPFDIQHRHVLHYRTGSPGDFQAMKREL